MSSWTWSFTSRLTRVTMFNRVGLITFALSLVGFAHPGWSVMALAQEPLSDQAAAAPAAAAPKPLRALLITGGCCHDYDTQKNLIAKGLEARAHIEVTVVQQGGSATNSRIPLYEDPLWAEGYDIVLHDECFADVDDPAWTARVLEPHRKGTPAVVIHCAMHCYRDGTDQWFEFCGVTSRTHGAHYPHEVLNRDAEHPIMSDFGAAWANPAGELYWIEKLWPSATPLAAARNREKGNEEVCVWTNDYRGTRVFGTTLGHHNETVDSDEFLDLLTRGTLWACDKLNDEYLIPEMPVERPINVAQGSAAKASSEETDRANLAALAVDGQAATRWCADGPSDPQWLQIEFPQATTLNGCRIDWEFPDSPYQHTVEVSLDGQSWEQVADAKSVEAATAAQQRTSASGITHSFDQREVKFLRVNFFGGDPGCWCSIRELQAYGTETEIVDPQAALDAADAELLSEVKVPEGFRATLFAKPPAVAYPVFVATAPDGTTYVSVDRNGSLDREPRRGSIQRLRDLDGDGRADESKLFAADIDSPRGLVWLRDRLIVLHPPHLSALIDADGDGFAERTERLVSDIAFGFADRPADHTSNGVTIGIDGWLYLAIGDFGFMKATGADGREVQLRGGGVVRVRPDGSGLHVHSRGTRNILEVGLSPQLDGFARDNTNDGGGWDIRLHHFGGFEDHGYPTRFLNFTDEIVAPLADYGGGSGCGACYVAEPGYPEGFGHALYTADWGRDAIFRHQVQAAGGTFTADQTEFIHLPRATDLDVDAAGRIVAASWRGASFTYVGEEVGFLVRVEPIDHQPAAVLDTLAASEAELIEALVGASHRGRLAAQHELLSRGWSNETATALRELAANQQLALDSRIAALFTLALGLKDEAEKTLIELCDDDVLRPWGVRALCELPVASERTPVRLLQRALADASARTRLEAIRGIVTTRATLMNQALVSALSDSDSLVRHTAANALVELQGWKECLAAWDAQGPSAPLALQTASRMVNRELVEAVAQRLAVANETSARKSLFKALARLRFVDGTWTGVSWGTRPDTRGPVYQPEDWEGSQAAINGLNEALVRATTEEAGELIVELRRHRLEGSPFSETLLGMTRSRPEYLDVALDWLAQEPRLQPATLEMLVAMLEDDKLNAATLARVISVSWKSASVDLATQLVALQRLQTLDAQRYAATYAELRTAEGVQRNANDLVTLLEEPTLAPLALSLLLAIDAPNGSGPAAAEITAAMQRYWETPDGAAAWISAIEMANDRRWEDRITQALGSTEPALVAHAERLAELWQFEPLVRGEGPTIAEVGREATLAAIGSGGTEIERGGRWFARLNCANCHTLREGETPRGPHLPNVAKTYDRRQLAEAILLPSKTLAQGFVTEAFEFADGGVLTGFVVREEAERIAVRDAQGREHLIEVADIEARQPQSLSVMPEGIVDQLAPSDLEALLDYLQSLK